MTEEVENTDLSKDFRTLSMDIRENDALNNYGMYVGINGLGRIGKFIFLQLLQEKVCRVKAINIPGFDIKNLETYLAFDSTHTSYARDWNIEILNETQFAIDRGYGKLVINLLNSRDPAQLNWRKYNVEYVIDTTGVFLTSDACEKHNVDYVIMCAPPKDNTDQFVYNVNHLKYNGERFVSNASCTTNCLTPVLKVLNDTYGVDHASFTTIHACTASQNTIDTNNFKNRTSRSILNNIIPHSTGANKSVTALIPELKDRIMGTSLRVPVNNVSIVDLTIHLKAETDLSIDQVIETLEASKFVQICRQNRVSSDYNTTKCPSIVDKGASMKLAGKNEFKLMIWYDNEFSYCAQVVRLGLHMAKFNTATKYNKNNSFIANPRRETFKDRHVVVRVDWNVPIGDDGIIQDNYRIVSSLKTIKAVLNENPAKVIIISHMGRPDSKIAPEERSKSLSSWSHYIDQLQPFFPDRKLNFLRHGLSDATLNELGESSEQLFLLENIRFHPEETKYAKLSDEQKKENKVIEIFNKLADYYVNDAFGCCHREHLSIVGATPRNKVYGFLIDKELKCLQVVADNRNNDRILAIVGGGKMQDKLELLKNLSKKVDGIYIAGGNVNSIYFDDTYTDYLADLKKNRANIHLMTDGLAATDLTQTPVYRRCNENTKENDRNDVKDERRFFFDIGMESIIELNELIQKYDTIFWNGTLGVVENKLYSYGSTTLVNILMKAGKKVIIGGGDTACFCNRFDHNFHFVSTGGGASIDYISNGSLFGTKFFENEEL